MRSGCRLARHLALRDGHDVDAFCAQAEAELGLPCFVKPANMGSSVGVSKARTREQLRERVLLALQYDEWILAEEYIRGREIEVARARRRSARSIAPR